MDNIVNLFVREHGAFSRLMQFEVVVLALAVIIILNYYFKDSYTHVIVLTVFTIAIVSLYIRYRSFEVSDFNKTTMIKLNYLQSLINRIVAYKVKQFNSSSKQKLSPAVLSRIYSSNQLDNMYVDANMIHFVHSLAQLYNYNPQEFHMFIKGVNNILGIRREIEEYHSSSGTTPDNISESLESAIQLKANTINNLHNFIYSVPKQQSMYKYVDDAVERYNILITRNIDIIHTHYKQRLQHGLTSRSKIVSYDATKPYNAADNHEVINTKTQSKLIQFYN